jgi:alcohol dehydrogenase YqhD (iron-dependent ADH family)
MLEHELSALYDMTHGAGLAVVFPAYMQYTLLEDVDRYYRLATQVFGVPHNYEQKEQVANEGIVRLMGFFVELGMPITLEEAGGKKEDIDALLEKFKVNIGENFGRFMQLNLEDARKIYELTSEEE